MPNTIQADATGLPDDSHMPRRGFLRALAGLPLIGGSVTLIGSPAAVAEPVTELLMREYADWLVYEHHGIMEELTGYQSRSASGEWRACWGAAYSWHRHKLRCGGVLEEDGPPEPGPCLDPPSKRAALVLSAVGCNWKGAHHG